MLAPLLMYVDKVSVHLCLCGLRFCVFFSDSGAEEEAARVVTLRCCSPRNCRLTLPSASRDWVDALLQDGDRPVSLLPEGLHICCVYSSPNPHQGGTAAAGAAAADQGGGGVSSVPAAGPAAGGGACKTSSGAPSRGIGNPCNDCGERPIGGAGAAEVVTDKLQLPPSRLLHGVEQQQTALRTETAAPVAPAAATTPSPTGWHSQDGDSTASTLSAAQLQHSGSSSTSTSTSTSTSSMQQPRVRGLLSSPFPTSSPLECRVAAKPFTRGGLSGAHEGPPRAQGGPCELRCCLCCFTFERQIGRGGFSRVFRVRSNKSGKLLAVKVIQKEKIENDPQRLRRALAEREVMASSRSPFVLQLLCSFQTEKELFLVTDFCPGGEQCIFCISCLSFFS